MSVSEINSASDYDTSTDGQQSGPQEIPGAGDRLEKSTQSVEELPAAPSTLRGTFRQVIAGQHGKGPTCCCRLRTGCIVVACILCLWGVGGVGRVLIINFGLASQAGKRVQSFEKIKVDIFENPTISAVDSLGSVVFWFSAGILLLVGAWNIFRICCLISSTLLLIGIIYELVLRGMVTLVLTQENTSGKDSGAKNCFLVIYWIYFFVIGAFLAYAFVCARAFYIQIKIGKYDKGALAAEPTKSSESTAKDSVSQVRQG